MQIHRAYRYRLFPTPAQDAALRAWRDALMFLWNRANCLWLDAERYNARLREFPPGPDAPPLEKRKWPSAMGLSQWLTALRNSEPRLQAVPRHCCQDVLVALDKSWRTFWTTKGETGTPRWKRPDQGDTAPLRVPGGTYKFVYGEKNTGYLQFPNLGRVDCATYRPLPPGVKLSYVSLALEVREEWWASVAWESEIADPPPNTKPSVGIDRGAVNLVADSTGALHQNPRARKGIQKRLGRLQKRLAKMDFGSKNSERLNVRVAKLQRGAVRTRDLCLHTLSKHYAENFSLVAVEDLGVQRMMKSAKGTVEAPGKNVKAKAGLNRALADSGLTRFVTQLRYKALTQGANVVAVNPAYSSQECSACGYVNSDNRPDQATFVCGRCGHAENADTNAAKVILARGLVPASVRAPKAKRTIGSPLALKRVKAPTAVDSTAKQGAEDR